MKCKRKKLKAKPKDLEGNTRKVNTQTAHKYLRFVDCEQKERKRQNGEEEKKKQIGPKQTKNENCFLRRSKNKKLKSA